MFMLRERSSQTRGYSVIYPMVALLKNLDRAWDATFERMVQESIQLGWITANPNDVKQQTAAMASSARNRKIHNEETGFKDYGNARTPGGMYIWENPNHQINFTDLKTPSNNFSNAQVEARIAAGMSRGVGPSFLAGFYEKSFSALKGEQNDTMKTVMYERQRYIEQVEQYVNLEYLKHYVRSGMLPVMPGFWDNHYIQQSYLSGKWIGEVPGHINPMQEVGSQKLLIEQGGLLRSDFAAMNGYSDFEAFLDEREEQERRFMTLTAEELTKQLMEDSERIDNE
jgi:capsid protein